MLILIQPFSYHLEEGQKGRKKRLNNHGGRGGGGDGDEYMTTVCMHASIYLHPHSQPSDKASSSIGASGIAVVCEQVSDCMFVPSRYIDIVVIE